MRDTQFFENAYNGSEYHDDNEYQQSMIDEYFANQVESSMMLMNTDPAFVGDSMPGAFGTMMHSSGGDQFGNNGTATSGYQVNSSGGFNSGGLFSSSGGFNSNLGHFQQSYEAAAPMSPADSSDSYQFDNKPTMTHPQFQYNGNQIHIGEDEASPGDSTATLNESTKVKKETGYFKGKAKYRKNTKPLEPIDPTKAANAEDRKRMQNTLAARKTRARREARQLAMEAKNAALTHENAILKQLLVSTGMTLPKDIVYNPSE